MYSFEDIDIENRIPTQAHTHTHIHTYAHTLVCVCSDKVMFQM
jgi:hypothetical protein